MLYDFSNELFGFKDDNGKADHFDTRRQDTWMEWCDEDDE